MMMSGMNGGSNSSSNNNKYPFTASQWQELENQALIFKYMACGYPIPSDLILHIRRSVLMDSTTAASLFPLQPSSNLPNPCFSSSFSSVDGVLIFVFCSWRMGVLSDE